MVLRIFYKTKVYPPRQDKQNPDIIHEEHLRYEFLSAEFCCKKTKDVFNDRYKFAANRFEGNHKPTLSLIISHGDEDDMMSEEEFSEIAYCPYCGANIDCVEQDRINMKPKVTTETVERVSYVESRE